MYLASVPHRYGRLSWSHSITARDEVGACLQTLRSELQTHEAELHLAAWTDDVLASRLVVLHLVTAGGAGPDGGAAVNPLHLREGGDLAGPEELEVVVDAAVIAAAIGAWSRTFPRLQTLPAELVHFLLFRLTHDALHVQISQVFSLNVGLAARTL